MRGDRSRHRRQGQCIETSNLCVFMYVTNIHWATAKPRVPCRKEGVFFPWASATRHRSLESSRPTSRCWLGCFLLGPEAESVPVPLQASGAAGVLGHLPAWRETSPTSVLVFVLPFCVCFSADKSAPSASTRSYWRKAQRNDLVLT